jgi:hypothetical protein
MTPPDGRRTTRRPRWAVAVATGAVLAAVGTAGLLATGDEQPDFEVAVPATVSDVVDPAGAARALGDLERALKTGNAELAAAAASGPEAEELLRALTANATEARIVDVSLRYVDALGPLSDDEVWPAAVAVEWRYDGFDRAPASTETVIRFAGGDGEVGIAGVGGDTLRTPVWMSGPLTVRRGADSLVLIADESDADRYERLARKAVPAVSRVVTDWEGRLVVEVPANRDALERALDVEPGYYQQIAAVTGTADGSIAEDAPVHVFVNPEVFDILGASGQEVVLQHETAHVAGDGPTSRAPTWLVEGFADYVALRDTDLPLSVTAAQIRDQVRAKGPPDALPGPEDFDTRGPHLGAVYESAWLACVVLAERAGDQAFLEFYEDVSAGEPVSRELRRSFGWSTGELARAWRKRLSNLPG